MLLTEKREVHTVNAYVYGSDDQIEQVIQKLVADIDPVVKEGCLVEDHLSHNTTVPAS